MAPLPDFDGPGLVHIRAAVSVPHRHGGQGRQGVRLGHGGGGFQNPPGEGGNLLAELGEQLVLQGHHPLGGGEDGVFQLLQFLGDVPLRPRQGLLADVALRHLALVAVGNLNGVAKDLVVLDLQGPDARALPLPGLHLGDDALAVFQDVPQAVHLRVEAVPDQIPLPDGEGGLVADGLRNARLQVLQGVQLLRKLREAAVRKGRQAPLDLRQLLCGGAQGRQVPPPGGSIDDAADEPLQVPQAGEGGDELLPVDGPLRQGRHGPVPPGDGGHVQQGPLQPAPEAAAPHGGLGPVQHPEEAALLLLAPQGLGQLQVPPRRQVQFHEAALFVVVQVVDVGEVRLLGLV